MTAATKSESWLPTPAIIMLVAGVVAALHVGKVAPAIPVLQQALGMSLVQAGFLISLIQMAGMLAGLAIGLAVGGWGLRRSVLSGLTLITVTSTLGALSQHAGFLLLMRAIEGLGFLLVVMSGPSLLRLAVGGPRTSLVLGLWSSYMPLGQGLAILAGAWVIAATNWQAWWLALALVSAVVAWWAWRKLPHDSQHAHSERRKAASPADSWRHRLMMTLRSPGPWLVSLTFAAYAGQWMAVVGFLPSIYSAAGIAAGLAGAMTALVSVSNIVGNVLGGRLLTHGVQPQVLLWTGFAAMALASIVAFANLPLTTPILRYVAIILFSAVGGLIPATLFTLAIRLSPSENSVPITVGWMQQWIALGQLAMVPIVGAVAAAVGGWQWTWAIMVISSLIGATLTYLIWRELKRKQIHAGYH